MSQVRTDPVKGSSVPSNNAVIDFVQNSEDNISASSEDKSDVNFIEIKKWALSKNISQVALKKSIREFHFLCEILFVKLVIIIKSV